MQWEWHNATILTIFPGVKNYTILIEIQLVGNTFDLSQLQGDAQSSMVRLT